MADQLTSRATLDRVKARLAELRKRRGPPSGTAPGEISAVAWPRDLNASGEVVSSTWGADPAEDA